MVTFPMSMSASRALQCLSPARLPKRPLSTTSPLTSPRTTVIFDMGGVILPSPFSAAYKWEAERGYQKGTVFSTIKHSSTEGSWARLERGELSLEEFYSPFAKEAAALHKDASLTAELMEDFMTQLTSSMTRPDEDMLEAIASLKAQGMKVALLTNNWRSDRAGRLLFDGLELFDEVIESCVEGMRKPESRIYRRTLERLGVAGSEAVFLDDIPANLRPAEELGIATVLVKEPAAALVRLQEVLGRDLGHVPGTEKVRRGMELDKGAVREYMASLGRGDGEVRLKQFQHGQSNPTYLVQFQGRDYVLRKKPPGSLLAGAHAIEREYRVMAALAEAGLPVPAQHGLCEDSAILGTPFYLMDYVAGRIYKDPSLPGLLPEDRRKVYSAMNKTLAQIHAVDVHAAGIADYGKHGDYVKRSGLQVVTLLTACSQTGEDLEPSVPGEQDWRHRGHGGRHGLAPGQHPGPGQDLRGARRLQGRQPHL